MSEKTQNPAELALRLLPERITYLLEDRPLLWTESAEDYDALFTEYFAEMDPKGITEVLLVKDIVDYVWEIRRMRRLKVAAMQAEMPVAAGALLDTSLCEAVKKEFVEINKGLIFAAVAGKELQQKALMTMMRDVHVTPQMMQYEAFKAGLGTITAIDGSILRLERRRDQIMKQLAERRQAFKAMAKGLIDRDEAEAVDFGQVN